MQSINDNSFLNKKKIIKKIYLKPGMKVVPLRKQQLLSSSVNMYGKNATGTAMSRGFDDDDFDFDE